MKLSNDYPVPDNFYCSDPVLSGIYQEYRDIEKEKPPIEFVETANSSNNAIKNRYFLVV
jgi:hypothetical protein